MEEEIALVDHVNERNDSWVVEINDEVRGSVSKTNSPRNSKKKVKRASATIYRIPTNIRGKEDTFLYTPRIISFGPYHYDNISCKQTKDYKKCLLIHFLKRSNKELSDYLKALGGVVQDLKDAYHELDPRWQQDDNAFLKLMIYDGCCFLEILRKAESLDEAESLDKEENWYLESSDEAKSSDEAESLDEADHLGHLSHQIRITEKELIAYCKHDMLLLENQLPMQLLVKLVSIQKDLTISAATKELQLSILRFFRSTSSSSIRKEAPARKCCHVLNLYRRSLAFAEYRPGIFEKLLDIICDPLINCGEEEDQACTVSRIPIMVVAVPIGFIIGIIMIIILIIVGIILFPLKALRYLFRIKLIRNICFIIPSAAELVKVGIRIKPTETEDPLDLSFHSRTLKLPEIYVDAATESKFLNIIAFEKLHKHVNKNVTMYIYFMSRLIQARDDVRLLQLHGIIHTLLHNDQVVELFKSLTKDIVRAPWEQHPSHISSLQYRVAGRNLTQSFYSRMNNPWQQDLWQTYLKSPWTVISIIGAFFLFALTSVQTVYTLLSYYNPK